MMMNIALLAQSMQGAPQKGGDANATPTGQFLELLSAMLGTTPTASPEVMDVPEDEASLPLENVSNRLEQWLQQPDSLQWLKSLPADAYRKFMDAYIGILNQVAPEPAAVKAPDAIPALLTSQTAAPTLSFTLTKKETDTLVQTVPVDQVEENVRIIQQVVAQFKGTLGQTPKTLPGVTQPETQPVQVQQPVKETDWMPKNMSWSKPSIDSEMVMYASKGSLPENMQARIEAALQRHRSRAGPMGRKCSRSAFIRNS